MLLRKHKSTVAAFGAAAAFAACLAAPARAQAGFPDVPPDHWAAGAVRKLSQEGILKGYPQGSPQRAGDLGYQGDRPVTRYELAVTLARFIEYMERADRQKKGASGASAEPKTGPEAVRRLIAGGYLPKDTPLAREGGKAVTANQLADALSAVIVRVRERQTPITPDSRRAPIERPTPAPGG